MWTALWIILGVVGLAASSSLAVQGTLALAARFRISPTVAGLTITSVGSSIPEIATNLTAAWFTDRTPDAGDLAIGNVIGSCFSQITLLLGVIGTLAVVPVTGSMLRRHGGAAVAALIAMFLVCRDGWASRAEGMLLVAAYGAYLVWVIWGKGHETDELAAEPSAGSTSTSIEALRAAVGLIAVGLSAHLVVDQAVQLARSQGVATSLLGLMIGVGTGLPELTISIRGLRDKAAGLSVGTLIGSNITDPLLSFGSGLCAVAGWSVPAAVLYSDFVWWGGATLLALFALAVRGKLDGWLAAILFAVFGAYGALRIAGG